MAVAAVTFSWLSESQQIQMPLTLITFLGVSVMGVKDFLSVEMRITSKFYCTVNQTTCTGALLLESEAPHSCIIEYTRLMVCTGWW